MDPNPIPAGGAAELVIEVTEEASEEMTNVPESDLVTGAGARLQCWNGSGWIDTHQLLKDGFGPDSQPAAIPLGPDVTIPAVGLMLYDQPYTVVMPEMPPGVYRIQDSVVVGSSENHVYGLIEIEEAN